jgi:hypothetical protein
MSDHLNDSLHQKTSLVMFYLQDMIGYHLDEFDRVARRRRRYWSFVRMMSPLLQGLLVFLFIQKHPISSS